MAKNSQKTPFPNDVANFVQSAASGRAAEVATFLKYYPHAINEKSSGWTALTIAAARGRLNVVRLLVESGADPDLACVTGETALEIAQRKEQDEIIAFLKPHTKEAEEERLRRTSSAALQRDLPAPRPLKFPKP